MMWYKIRNRMSAIRECVMRMRISLFALLALAVGFSYSSAQAPDSSGADVIEAQRIVLRASDGTVRAMLEASSDKRSGLTIFDENHMPRLFIGMSASSETVASKPVIGLYDKEDKRLQAGLYETFGQVVFAMRDSTFTNSITMASTKYFTSITFWQRERESEWIKKRLRLKAFPLETHVRLYDEDGKQTWAAPDDAGD